MAGRSFERVLERFGGVLSGFQHVLSVIFAVLTRPAGGLGTRWTLTLLGFSPNFARFGAENCLFSRFWRETHRPAVEE